MTDAPRDDLIRMVALERADVSADGNTLHGYAAVFDDWTDIDSWEGTFRERISPKAFDKTLSENGDRVKVLFNHGMDPQIGDKPLGKPSVMQAKRKGLWTETPLDETSYNADLKALLRSGALDGMSFRFSVMDDDWDEGDDGVEERTIKEVKLFEFGPVTFPAYEATTAGIRNAGAFKVWRSTHRDGNGATDNAVTEGRSISDEDRSTEEAAASSDDDRDTSVLETWKAKALLLSQDVDRQREEYGDG